jgi:FkbM family methyltransferase
MKSIKKNLRKCMNFFSLRGYTVKDTFWINLAKFTFLFYKFFNRETSIGYYLCKDAIAKNSYGIFFCRKASSDLSSIAEHREFEVIEKFKEIIRPGDMVIDCGGHVGKYAILASRLTGNNGKIITFEPHPGNYEILLRNLRLNKCSNVTAFNIGVWKEKGLHTLSLCPYHAQHSMMTDYNKDYLRVKVDKLDTILKKNHIKAVKLLKIDVEGAEYAVLLGSLKSLKKRKILNIILETHPKQLKQIEKSILIKKSEEFLKSFGYSIQKLSKEHTFAKINEVFHRH